MLMKLLFIVAIIIQTVAIFFAIRLVRLTKYNAVWILFIVGFMVLSGERYMQLINYNGGEVPQKIFNITGFLVSIGLSIGVMYAHKLFLYIERLNHQRTLTSRRILNAVLRAEERSRSRVSKDLHDGLGPLLSSAKMSLSALDHTSSESERREIISSTTEVIDEAIRSLREISNNLSPQILNDFGLNKAVSQFVNKSATLHATKIQFATNLKGERYDINLEVIIYRVICELINNSLKHAQCSKIELSLNNTDSTLLLEYQDNGRGFSPQAMIDCGMGLSNISSRINSLGGTLDIHSSKGLGMSCRISIKL